MCWTKATFVSFGGVIKYGEVKLKFDRRTKSGLRIDKYKFYGDESIWTVLNDQTFKNKRKLVGACRPNRFETYEVRLIKNR